MSVAAMLQLRVNQSLMLRKSSRQFQLAQSDGSACVFELQQMRPVFAHAEHVQLLCLRISEKFDACTCERYSSLWCSACTCWVFA